MFVPDNQQAFVSEALRRKAQQATKTLLQDAKTQGNQIRGVMEARANGGVKLVEGPGGKQEKEWEAVPSTDEKGQHLSNTKRRKLHFLGKQDAKRGGKSVKRCGEILLADDTTTLTSDFRHAAEDLQLPSVQNVLNNHISVEGCSLVEVFAGHAMLTVALVWSMVPCMAP